MKLLIDGGKFLDGGMRDPTSDDGFLMRGEIGGGPVSLIMRRPRRWPIGLAITIWVVLAPAVAHALTCFL